MTKSSKPSISVLICNYNKEAFICNTLDSVLSQTYKPSQIVIVDDASTDNSVSLISEYAQQYAEIELVQLKNNVGLSNARNVGIKNIKNPLIAFIDSDDLWHDTKLEKQVDMMQATDSDFIYNEYSTFDDQGHIKHDYPKPFLRGDGITKKLIEGNFIMGSSSAVLCKFDKVLEAGGFDGALQDIAKSFAEDWDLWLRLSKICKFDYVNEPLTQLYTGGGYYKTPEDEIIIASRFKAHFWVRNKHWDDPALRQIITEKTIEEWKSINLKLTSDLKDEVLGWVKDLNQEIARKAFKC